MTEVSNFYRLSHHQEDFEPEGEFYLPPNAFVDFDSFCLPNGCSSPLFLDDNAASFDFAFDLDADPGNLGSACEDASCFDVEEEEMNFVTDLYDSQESLLPDDPVWELDSDRSDDLDLEFGFGQGFESDAPGSDCEDFEVNSSLVHDDVDDSYDEIGVYSNFHIREIDRDEFEWEEISERIQFDERETLSSVIDRIDEISIGSNIEEASEAIRFDDDRETLISVIDHIDEVSIPSNIEDYSPFGIDEDEEYEDEGRSIEWEVLLAANDLDNNININETPITNLEYETLFGQLVDNENWSRGSPPAAKKAVESLPVVVLTKELSEKDGVEVVCAVCKDGVVVGEKATRLPCYHLYHGECILPWLGIRNTCPVCRYELPTDDADYERRKREGGSATEVRYNFEHLL